MSYITLQELKNNAELVGVSFADYDAEIHIAAACAGIDEYTGRTFTSSVGTRYYTPVDRWHLDIDDAINVTSVMTDYDGDGTFETTWTENTDYVLVPLNATANGEPFDELQMKRYPYSSHILPMWPRSVQVQGTFGWPAVPAPIKSAAMIMSMRLLRRAREAPFGIVGLGIDNVAVRISKVDPDLAWLVDPFIKGPGAGVMIS